MTPAQCRAARGYLDLTMKEVEHLSGVALSVISRFERGQVINSQAAYIQKVFENKGIVFLAEGILYLQR